MDSILTKQSRRTQKSFNMLIRQGNDILIYKPYAINFLSNSRKKYFIIEEETSFIFI